MTDLIWVLRALEGIVLLVGASITYQSFVAYRRTRRRSLVYLAVGFLLVSVAAAIAGVLYEFLSQDLLTAWVASAAFDSVGFLVILYSIVRPSE